MTSKAELRARIVAARRAHDAAIRSLDRRWKELLGRLGETPKADHADLIDRAELDLAAVLAFTGKTER